MNAIGFGLCALLTCHFCIGINGDSVAHINDAIIYNLEDDFSLDAQQQGQSAIETFVRDVLRSCHVRSHLDVDVGTAALPVELHDCEVSSFNATACRQSVAEKCVGAGDILHRVNVDEIALQDIFPALLNSVTNPLCVHEEVSDDLEHHVHEKTPSWKAWTYGCLFAVVLCLVSNVGAFMVPLMKTTFFKKLLLFCVGLAVGTMAATGFLVLLPESLDLTGEDSPVPDYKYKMSCALAAIYFFYVMEKILKKWFKRRSDKNKNKATTVEVDIVIEKEDLVNGDAALVNGGQDTSEQDSEAVEKKMDVKHGHSHGLGHEGGIATVAYVLMAGDSLHKFVDGVSVGAAFTENVYVGFSVALAIVCEELPHELGDVAILLQAGVPIKRALFVNTMTAAVSILGVVVGILIGENTNANMWIFAVAGGMFVYIALIDMLPEMELQAEKVIESNKGAEFATFFLQNTGLIIGFSIMLLIAVYGGDINI